MNRIKYFFNNIEFTLGALFSVIMVVVEGIGVISRFIFNSPLHFVEETATICFVFCVYFGAVGATRRNQHISMEVVVSKLSPKNRVRAAILANITFMLTNCVLIYGLYGITKNLMLRGMRTAMLGIPKWICYAVIPICLVLIIFRLLMDTKDKIHVLKNWNEEAEKANAYSVDLDNLPQ